MWVADMDFCTAPCVTEAIVRRAEHGIFGYSVLPDEWYEAYMNWWSGRHGFNIKKEWLLFCTGVVPAVSSIVRSMTAEEDNVVVMTPVYNIFFNSILNNRRNVSENKLIYSDGRYSVDFDDLEKRLSDPHTTLLIFCNPHNPTGQIWDAQIIGRIGEMCKKHNVCVLSDEIHCDITKPDKDYIPFASVSETCMNNSITCISPTKTFNIAGIQTSAVVIPDKDIRSRVEKGLNADEVAEPNVFAAIAAAAAFNGGGAWLDELRAYLWSNRQTAVEFIEREIAGAHVVRGEATYLLWIDMNGVLDIPADLARYVRKKSGLFLSDGRAYRNGDGFLRMNIACPKSRLAEGLDRLKKAAKS